MQITRSRLPALVAALCLLLLLLQCSARRGGATNAIQTKDSVSIADSNAVRTSTFASTPLTYEERQGKVLFTKYCSVCHGTEGKGDGFNAFNLDPRPRDLSDKEYMSAFSEERLYQTIDLGGRGMNKSPSMPSWGGRLNRADIRYVIAYVQSMSAR
jgi:mono/diheme cytochrome c family protein